MKLQSRLVVVLGLSAVISQAFAHPLDVVESQIRKEERAVQFLDAPAPTFRLADAHGRPVGLVDLRGQVVVLNFVDSRRSEARRAHMALIARLQAMVNTAAMRDQVQFISIATEEKDRESRPVAMSSLARTYGLDMRNWRSLYAIDAQAPGTTHRLASAYSVDSANQGAEKDIVTYVVDQAGRLRARFYGLEFEPVNLVSYVNALLNDDHSRQ